MFTTKSSILALALCCSVAVVGASNAAGEAFLAENAKKEGVVTLASGLQYKVLESGPSPGKSPLVGTPTECHYAGTLIDGTEFDSSYKRGAWARAVCRVCVHVQRVERACGVSCCFAT